MCNRFWTEHQIEKIADRYRVRRIHVSDDEMPYEVYPDRPAPIVRVGQDGERELVLAQWGLVPPWVKDADLASFIKRLAPNNARDDTIARNLAERRGMFYAAMKSGRCILPAVAWCEWTGEKGSKVAHRLSRKGSEGIAFAGMCTYRKDPGLSCTMVTTAAVDDWEAYHHRIPVVLRDEDVDRWLDPTSEPLELLGLFQSLGSEELAEAVA